MLRFNSTPRKLRIQEIREFLGSRLERRLLLGIGVGFALFGVEVAFAYSLQLVLATLGTIQWESVGFLKAMDSRPSVPLSLGVFVALGCLRALILSAQLLNVGTSSEEYRFVQRTRITKWAMLIGVTSASRAINLFNERVVNGAAYLRTAQDVFIRVVTAVFLALALFRISPLTTSLGITAMVLVGLFLRKLDHGITVSSLAVKISSNKINESLIRNLRNLLFIQIVGMEKREEKKAQAFLQDAKNSFTYYQQLIGLKFAVPQIAGAFMVGAIVWVLHSTEIGHSGNVVTFLYLFVRFVQIFADVVKSSSELAYYRPHHVELFEWWRSNRLGLTHGVAGGEPEKSSGALFHGPIGWELKNVTFSYPGEKQPILREFSMSIHAGEFFAIRGRSGIGKSTLIGVLLGILKPQEGEVLVIDSQGKSLPLSGAKNSLLKLVGYVGPENFLIEGTIRENLLYGADLRTVPDDATLLEALAFANCDFVQSLDRGLDHFLTDQGHGLSAGQKQRLALARAALRNPTVLILDEATSNLDSRTEMEIVERTRTLKGRMTIVAISHREALFLAADRTHTMEVRGPSL